MPNLERCGVIDVSSVPFSFNYLNFSHGSLTKLTDFGGFRGMKYTMNFKYMPNLSHESLLNILNEAGEATEGAVMYFTQAQIDSLTEGEKAVATVKGWEIQPAN